MHRAEGFACGTHREPPKPKDFLPPPKRRTTPLGGILGAQWTDSVTHVPITVPALPDQPGRQVAGSFGDLVAHATRNDDSELPPPLCLVSALPELLGTGSGIQVAFRNPSFASPAIHKKGKCHNTHASYLISKRSMVKVRPLPKGHQVNSARRDAQAIASILGEPTIPSGANVNSHHVKKASMVGGIVQVASVKPGAAQGDCKTPVASPGPKTL